MRKIILFTVTLSFISLVFGITGWLHLLCHEDDAHHDSEDCSICQRLVFIGKNVAELIDTPEFLDIEVRNCFEIEAEIFISEFADNLICTRAPPSLV